ncbi:MAG: hypothetical protein FWF85_10430, partial [Clostridiales bacterium]|nr:hypothetical protein [Clostridiales bacterium]
MAKNTYFKTLSRFLILVMILAILPAINLSAETNAYGKHNQFLAPILAPAPEDIKIYTAGDLNNVRYNLNGSYVLMNDIDLATWGEWEPIGDFSNPFRGDFDGQGYIIRNLTITNGTYQYIGLFGRAIGTAVKNVGLEYTYINISSPSFSSYYAGGICGYSIGSISNCHNTGDIFLVFPFTIDIYSFSGGICGSSSSGKISNCYNEGNILAAFVVGGIIGVIDSNAEITSCYNTGNITCAAGFWQGIQISQAGGILGNFNSVDGSIANCYNTGDITADVTGGIVGVLNQG